MNSLQHSLRTLPLLIVGSLAALSVQADIRPVTAEHCALMSTQGVISEGNPVSCDRLRVVSFQYRDLDGQDDQSGEVMVLDALAKNVQALFDTLHERGFAIGKARLIEHYAGDDDASMADNNTSAFNGRKITGGDDWSIHAYGAAIDLNPRQNPFISIGMDGSAKIHPPAVAREAVNRLDYRPGKDSRPGQAEEVVDLFANHGFINWGGYWNFPIDYQHFEVGSKTFVKRLATASPERAERIFDRYVRKYRSCIATSSVEPHAAARKSCAERVMK